MIKSTKIIYCQLNFINDVTFKHYLHKIKLAYKGKVMKKKILMTVFDLILFVVLVVSIFLSYNYVNFQLKKEQIEDSMSEELAVLHENINENEPKYTLDYYKNYYHNDDIVGRLKIYNTGIDTLIVQSTNNEYYLNHTLEKNTMIEEVYLLIIELIYRQSKSIYMVIIQMYTILCLGN